LLLLSAVAVLLHRVLLPGLPEVDAEQIDPLPPVPKGAGGLFFLHNLA
jgi:hypothetical protein